MAMGPVKTRQNVKALVLNNNKFKTNENKVKISLTHTTGVYLPVLGPIFTQASGGVSFQHHKEQGSHTQQSRSGLTWSSPTDSYRGSGTPRFRYNYW